MIQIEELVEHLKVLTPGQLEQVAEVIQRLSSQGSQDGSAPSDRVALPPEIVERAVGNGWQRELFTEVIGSLPDFQRLPQPQYDNRPSL